MAWRSVVSVAPTDANDVRAPFSNWGQPADVGAPGVDMVGPYAPGGWVIASGTSFSCPLVAGQVALRLAAPGGIPVLNVLPPQLSGVVTNLLIQTSVDITVPNHGDPGFGRIDLPRSLGLAPLSPISFGF